MRTRTGWMIRGRWLSALVLVLLATPWGGCQGRHGVEATVGAHGGGRGAASLCPDRPPRQRPTQCPAHDGPAARECRPVRIPHERIAWPLQRCSLPREQLTIPHEGHTRGGRAGNHDGHHRIRHHQPGKHPSGITHASTDSVQGPAVWAVERRAPPARARSGT